MAWVTKNSEETYAPAPPPREYTKQEKAANWWHYHKVGVLVVIVLVVLLSWVLHDALFRTRPDVEIGYVGAINLPEETVAALEQALVPYCTDLNGDGQVLVELRQFTVDFDADTDTTDPYSQMAGITQLSAELAADSNFYLFLLQDPAGFEAQCGVLAYLDGTLPPTDGTADWTRTVYRWTDCPTLTGLDLGSYQALGGSTEEGNDSQQLLGTLYLGRRGVWSEEIPAAYTDTAPLWEALTAGAVSTAGEG